jgi:hypothetical protein
MNSNFEERTLKIAILEKLEKREKIPKICPARKSAF